MGTFKKTSYMASLSLFTAGHDIAGFDIIELPIAPQAFGALRKHLSADNNCRSRLKISRTVIPVKTKKPAPQRKVTRRLDSRISNFQTNFPIRPESIFPSFRNKFQKN